MAQTHARVNFIQTEMKRKKTVSFYYSTHFIFILAKAIQS